MVGTINDIMQGGWCYYACQKCSKKLNTTIGGFNCETCNKKYSHGISKFRLRIRVTDETKEIVLLLWDDDAQTLVGMTADQIKEKNGKVRVQHLLHVNLLLFLIILPSFPYICHLFFIRERQTTQECQMRS